MNHQSSENVGKRPARFACGNHVHIESGKNSGKLPESLRQAAAVDNRMVEGGAETLKAGLLQPLDEHRQRLIESHSCRQQVRKLFRK